MRLEAAASNIRFNFRDSIMSAVDQQKPISLCRGAVQIGGASAEGVHVPQAEQSAGGIPTKEIPRLLARRFAEPLEFPPVYQSIVPGDSVVVAVAPGTLNGTRIAVATADLLVEQGVDRDGLLLLFALPGERDDAGNRYPTELFDATDEQQHAYLIAGHDGSPVYVCRTLFDADVVIPLGGFHGAVPRDAVCPAFCNQTTREYLTQLGPRQTDAEINAINDNLGIFWQISVMDGPGGVIDDVLVGDRRAVLQEGVRRMRKMWGLQGEWPQSDLVIVTLESPEDQSWENARAALRVADRIASGTGAIALVSRINTPPARRDHAISDLLDRRHVYLFSDLPGGEAERFGFAPIGGSEEINRLIRHYGEATLVRDGHKVDIGLAKDAATV